MLVEELTLKTASLANVLDWLTQPQGPHLVDGTSTKDPLTALAILITPEALYDPDSPMVGLGLVYKAPYIWATSWSKAYFNLKLASQAEASNQTAGTKVIFIQIQESSQVIPLPGVPTLFLDVKTPEDITDSKIDQTFSKSLMVEFLRLKVIIEDDLSETLWTWQTDMEAATDKFLRDLDAATQTSTTLPSKNAAVGVALCQFREAAQLRLALPLT